MERDATCDYSARVAPESSEAVDLDAIERDLADVELAMSRLDAGTYWTDEVTGAEIAHQHLVDHPLARRNPPASPDNAVRPLTGS